uniref:G-protein coupled receptors family 3 profile domain-containing protein n=1 Tax=Plectus sambesii TaxID=2011161 RepID=A0A914V777_9BILA
YVEEQFKCALTPESTRTYGGKLCSGDELVDVSKLGRLTKSGYLSRGVERFLFAMDAVYKRMCPEQTGICDQFFASGRREIIEILKTTLIEDDFDIMNLRPGDDGKVDYYKIGNWSSETGLRFSETYRFYDASGKAIPAIKSTCRPPLCKCNLDADFFTKPLQAAGSFMAREKNLRNFEPFEPEAESALEQLVSGEWRNQPWNYVFLVLITLLLIVAIAVLILVSVKLYLRVVKGNQSLGICLLLGVIMLYATAYLFVFDASETLCRCRLFFHSLSYTICFGVMIAKATQLRNAETLGFANSTHISYWNY